MAVLFNKVERGNPADKTAPKKWYPVLKTISRVEEKEVAKQISDETTLNRKEAEMGIDQLEKVLINNLLSGNTVQIGDWGTFMLTCKSEGSTTKEGVTAANIKGLNIRFIAGKRLREALANATFVSAESL